MNIINLLKPILSAFKERDIPACVIGEIALNYYNVPRVVHDLEICVPETSLSEAVSIACSTGKLKRVEITDYDLFTEYKRGFPTFEASNIGLRLLLFPDSYFGLFPLQQNIISNDERLSTTCSDQILDLVPRSEIQYLPVPRLPVFFIGLCSRFFESNDCMARIAVEQLVDGMDLNDDWIESNLGGATLKVRELAAQLVAEKTSRYDENMGPKAMKDLSSIPESGF
ncbi:uncharacterized protein Z518_08904 [Rhinocladiella mackenziei CBS 650.93]|uniref:Uncharacterized protein n=1 Tax=Rhinocladiella mackenziei CBS 650.93 TaxID=1442369 RepID=A0A0D2I5V8_9EURO|nr:uncharacterized protein Z518_08904 [Rhinocladiella mackenziei CBS 650.93]KIX01179.1 hypothetical protein Z518_08904 [Rhinocladiella mackenziei CBS 650.93]